jgi:hypothetical protein
MQISFDFVACDNGREPLVRTKDTGRLQSDLFSHVRKVAEAAAVRETEAWCQLNRGRSYFAVA